MLKNIIEHIEWTTRQAPKLQAFYSKIFDWKFREAMPGYTMIDGVGGIFAAPDPQMPIGITPYVNVKDVAETEKKIKAAGGKIHKSQQVVPNRGTFSIFTDPDGTLMAIWQAAPRRPAKKKAVAKRNKTKR